MLFSVIALYPLLPILAHGYIDSDSTTTYTLSAHDKKWADVNDNDNVDVNNPSSDSGNSNNNTPKAVVLNFYDDDKSQFTIVRSKEALSKHSYQRFRSQV